MGTVQLADIYEPETFALLEQERQTESNLFIRSGIAVPSRILQEKASMGGRIIELPNFNPLDMVEPNISNDDPGAFSVARKIATTQQHARALIKNDSWSTMDFADELTLLENGMGRPMEAITNRIGDQWAFTSQKNVLNSLMGILDDNVANDSSDMVLTVGTDAVGAPTADEKISLANVLLAKQTMGDKANQIVGIAMHSAIYTTLQLQQQIITVPASATSVAISFYLGYEVLVDDSLPAVMGANRFLYTVVLFGKGLFGMASGRVNRPSELIRIPSAGNGAGQEILWSRRNDFMHPFGFDFTSTSVAAESASWAELADLTNWNRIWQRKNIPLAFLQVNN